MPEQDPVDAVKADAPEVPKKSKYGQGIPDDFDLNRFEILNKDAYTVESLILNNTVRARLKLNANVSAVYRSLTIAEIQEIEKSMEYGQSRYTYNELHLKPTIASLEEITLGTKTMVVPHEKDKREAMLRSVPYELMDELVAGYVWFHSRTVLLIRGSDLKNC